MQKEKPYYCPKNWQNFGDKNPKRYGSIFVKWTNGEWHIIETTHYGDIHSSVSENEHMFEHMFMEPRDIFEKGEIKNGFTYWAKQRLKECSNKPFHLLESESELPENETYDDYMEWIVNNHLETVLGILSSAYKLHADKKTDFSKNYWDYLSNYGINPDNF